jgi:hypothetical protein
MAKRKGQKDKQHNDQKKGQKDKQHNGQTKGTEGQATQ